MGAKTYQSVDSTVPSKDKLKNDKNNKKTTNNKRNQENDCREEELSNSIVDSLLDINKLISGSDKRVKMVREDECENDFKVTSYVRIPMSKDKHVIESEWYGLGKPLPTSLKSVCSRCSLITCDCCEMFNKETHSSSCWKQWISPLKQCHIQQPSMPLQPYFTDFDDLYHCDDISLWKKMIASTCKDSCELVALPVSRTDSEDNCSILKQPVIKPRKCCEVPHCQLTFNVWYCPKCNKLVYSDHVKDHLVHRFMFQSSCQKCDSVQGSPTIISFTTIISKSSFLSVDGYILAESLASASKNIIWLLKIHLAYFKMYCFHLTKYSIWFKSCRFLAHLKIYPISLKTSKHNIINVNHSFLILKESVSLFCKIQLKIERCLQLKKLVRYNKGFSKVCKVLQGVVPHHATNASLVSLEHKKSFFYLVKSGVNSSIEVSCGLHKITYLMIDLRRGCHLTAEITAASLFNTSLATYSKTIGDTFIPGRLSLNAKSFYVSYLYNCLQNFTTETEPLQWKYSQLIAVSNKLIMLQHIVCGLDVTRCQELDDVVYDVQRPLDKVNTPATNATDCQSVTNSIKQQQSFPSQGTFQATGGLVRADQPIEGNKKNMVQSSAAKDDLLPIQPEGFHISVNHLPSSQGYHHSTDELVRTNEHGERKDQDILQSSPAKYHPSQIQPKGNYTPVPNANIHSQVNVRINEGDGGSLLQIEKDGCSYVEADGKLSTVSDTATVQATPISSMPLAHEFMIGNVNSKPSCPVDHNSLGAQFVKGSPRETKVLPTPGPHLGASYKTNFDHEVQSSQEEISYKGNARTTFCQHEVEQHAYNPIKIGELNSTTTNPPINDRLQVKPPEVMVETGKSAKDFKPKPLPKRSCIVYGSKQYPLGNNLVSLPHMDHYFVKERKEIRPSHYLAKLVLRHQYQNRDDVNEEAPAITAAQQSQAAILAADSTVEKDGAVTERKHFPMNLNRPGFVVFSSDLTRFTGSIKYPLPSKKATAVKLGKGGNGFVFAIFHNGKEYAVKKTVYRPNEIRVHSQLAHQNLVNLDAVLVGEEHEKHKGKFYAFCFMTKCDMDFRSVISTKDHGCLKHLKLQLSDQRDVWQLVVVNVKYVLRSVLKALDYMHAQGLVHRDVKASNVLLKMQCNCSKPLMCACPQKYLVKLGDFDSSTTVPGHGLRIEPHQMIRYASVLPLGTMGYRAPEVSMHLVIAGPYEVLYTTAVDIWSFGCLLLNMLIGKCGPLKQRGEASLLLTTQEQPYAESLYKQIIKIKELQKYYGDMPEMVDLVCKCLQVKVHCRPSAKQLLQLDILQCV